MKQRVFLALAAAMIMSSFLSAVSAPAAPPPPEPTPTELEEPVDGYDMGQLYVHWRYWVESRKGPVTEALLAEPEVLEGLDPFGVLLRFKRSNDFGHFLTGDIRAYCRHTSEGRHIPQPGSCLYVVRRAYVPLAAASYGKPNPLSDWTRSNFGAQSLARHLRAIGLTPKSSWWSVDQSAIFAMAASPKAVLTENVRIMRLDSRECPQMEAAIKALEGKRLGTAIDFATVGKDAQLRHPNPHAETTIYSMYLRGDGNLYTIEGLGGPSERLATPILNAADKCERVRKNAG